MKKIVDIPDEWKNTSALFIALGDEHRQRILLAFEPGERMNIMQIVAASELSRSAITHHLKVLRDSGAFISEKVGKEVFFRIDKPMMQDALTRVLEYLKSQA